jgi:hypothetical protein
MNISSMSHKKFYLRLCSQIGVVLFLLLFHQVLLGQKSPDQTKSDTQLIKQNGLHLSTFDIDVTPPVGSHLAYDPEINKWDLGLRAKGVVLLGSGNPIVLCAIDWLAISNEGMDAFKNALAAAAGTVPQRVTVNVLHQHDAPRYDGGTDGKVRATPYSTAKDSALRAESEGVIDSTLSLVSFRNGDQPVAILSYYATHPQSYYRTGVANPDFPGIARFLRQLAVPDALHIHFDGAGGNVAAGKYNDGSHENRLILANRLADAMKRAWDATRRQPITAKDVDWIVEPVSLPPAKYLYKRQQDLSKNNELLLENKENARKMAWLKRCEAGKQIDVACLKLKNARILYMPGELFVEYQLAAKAERPDLFVAMAAYGDLGPGYIGTAIAYEKGGYEVSEGASNVAPGAEVVLMKAIRDLLHHE